MEDRRAERRPLEAHLTIEAAVENGSLRREIDAAHAADTRLLTADCTRLDVNEGDHVPTGNREHHRAEINVLAERDAADIRVHILQIEQRRHRVERLAPGVPARVP